MNSVSTPHGWNVRNEGALRTVGEETMSPSPASKFNRQTTILSSGKARIDMSVKKPNQVTLESGRDDKQEEEEEEEDEELTPEQMAKLERVLRNIRSLKLDNEELQAEDDINDLVKKDAG